LGLGGHLPEASLGPYLHARFVFAGDARFLEVVFLGHLPEASRGPYLQGLPTFLVAAFGALGALLLGCALGALGHFPEASRGPYLQGRPGISQ